MKKIVTLLLAIVLIATCAGCGRATGKETAHPAEVQATPAPTPTPAPHEPTIALIIANHHFNYVEYAECRDIFMLDGFEPVIAGQQTGTAVSMDGHEETVNTLIGSLDAADIDALVVIGGSGASTLYNDAELHTLLQAVYAAGKPVAAICLAPVTLAEAGLLDGKKATVYPDEDAIAALEDTGAIYIEDSDIVTDGTIITANDSDEARDFAVTVLSQLDDSITAR